MSIEYYIAKALKKLRLKAVKDSTIDRTAHIAAGCHIYKSTIGRYTAIGYDCQLIHCQVGAFCSFASGIIVGGASHPMDWVSTSQVFVSTKDSINKKFCPHDYVGFKKTTIGNDVWIGDHVLIKAGITIANGAVLGMGSVVTKDVGPYEIWAGNPAKLIRKRFAEDIIEELEMIRLEKIDDELLYVLSKSIQYPRQFIVEYTNFQKGIKK